MLVTVYMKPGCHLCEDVLQIIDRLAPQYDLQVEEVNILGDVALFEAYREKIPVVKAGDGKLGVLVAPIDEPELHTYFSTVRRAMSGEEPVLGLKLKEPVADRVTGFIAHHWLKLITIAVGIFVGLPWLTPVFAALGWWGIADPLYTAYALT